ncbi:MAG: hypothetical protein R6V57_04800 [Vicinamibacterales bacterium]
MSVISHLVWHDIRALRLPLIAWVILLLAQAAVMAFGPGFIDPEEPRTAIRTFAGFLAGARLAFTVLLTVLLIQRDSPVGTTAFWLTRPIRPAAMAASKALSATLLLIVPPAVVGWVLFTALGLPQNDVLGGVWQLVIEQAMIVGLSAMGAAITATIPQFAVVAVAAVLLFGALIGQARLFIQQLPALLLAWSASPLAKWALVTLLGTVAVLVYQYSRRRVVTAAVMVIGVLVIGVLSAMTGGIPLDAVPPAPLRAGILDPAAVTLDVDFGAVRADWGSTNVQQGRPARYRSAGAVLRTSGAPPAVVLQPWSIASTWHPGNAPAIQWQRRSGAAYRRSVRDTDDDGQPLESIARALGGVELLRPVRSEPSAFHTTLLSLPEAEVALLSSAQGPLDATVTLRAWRYRVVEAAPLAAGNSVLARLGRLTVRAVDLARDGVLVDVRSVYLRRLMWTSRDLFGSGGVGSAEHLAIRNASRKQAILLGAESGRQIDYSLMSALSSLQFGTGVRRMRFVIPLADEDRVRLDDEWLAGAELVVLQPEDLGVFTRPLRVEWVNLEDKGLGARR